jgi:hypothetical protein
MDPWTIAIIVGTLVTAGTQIYQGQVTKRHYRRKADIHALKSKQDQLDYKEQGIEVIESLNEVLQQIQAQTHAGGLKSQQGTPYHQQMVSIRRGGEDYNAAGLNEILQQQLGLIQGKNLEAAGEEAEIGGYVSAAATVGEAAASYALIKGPPGGKPPKTKNPMTKTRNLITNQPSPNRTPWGRAVRR